MCKKAKGRHVSKKQDRKLCVFLAKNENSEICGGKYRATESILKEFGVPFELEFIRHIPHFPLTHER